MIKIQRTDPPAELTADVVKAKTEEYKSTGESVWKEDYITTALMMMSHKKCCYCECDLTVESNYMEVEHFHDKKDYQDEVVVWKNLLPSCKKCNGSKSTHDTIAEPIINPSADTPQNYMKLKNGVRFRGKDAIGRMTVDVLNLNDFDRHISPRTQIVDAISNKIEEFKEKADDYISNGNTSSNKKTRLRNGVLDLLRSSQPEKPYSAIRSTAVLTDDEYESLKEGLVQLSLWTAEMEELENRMRAIVYET